VLLDAFAQATGYHRGSGMWLLNHAKDVLHAPVFKRPSHYGPEVQQVLLLAWNTANRICAKRLIPFLPTLIDFLERHKQLHLTEKCRSLLLSMSAATADRLLCSQRKPGQPGFLEADLVAHCGTDIEGGYIYTLTLTGVATGWTECLPSSTGVRKRF
jgi:hypothetical protein